MFFSLRKKLILIYILLILLPLLVINYWAVENMKETVFREIEVNTLKTANIIANLSRDNFDDLVILKRIVRQYVPPLGRRILIISSENEVMADSFTLLEGNNINNKEVQNALQGREKLGYYHKQVPILQVAVPINRLIEGNRKVVGVVLISTSVAAPFQEVAEFQRHLLYISLIAALVGMMVAIVAGRQISKPILALSRAAKNIGEGNLGETVSINSRDEIGILANNFNQMSRELYRIDRGRTQFIGDVSHELKTPLASMKALIDSLIFGEDDLEVFREYLRDMDSEIDRLTQLIKSLLTLTKIEEQGLQLKDEFMGSLVMDTIKILRPLLDQSGILIHEKVNPNVKVICDRERIKEVLINLIDNAIKYSDVKKDLKEISVEDLIQKDSYHLLIKDNGIGIRQEDVESIFEKFYRADSSRSRDTGGAGIGLSIVEGIIKTHKWRIEVESQKEKGTTFKIIIPKGSFSLPS